MEQHNIQDTLETSTASTTSWAVAQRWFQRCAETHARCNLINTEMIGWYPTRLIDLGSFDSEPRLIITNDTDMQGRYVTLSHRWGSSQLLQLKTASLHSFRQEIPSSSLPRTFLDAMEVARRLGVRYIWIDSLCIIQDSRADWLKEAALMHQVYSGSLCNISATSGRESSLGLFVKRDPSLLLPCRIDMSWDDGPESSYQVDHTSFWASQVLEASLNQRAWVVQERLLSPRVLHFGHQQILWECRELDAAEKYPEKLPLVLASGQGFYKAIDPLTDDPHHNKNTEDQKLRIYQGWYRILGTYSDSLLTMPEDKLVAISGIARKVQTIMPDNRYVAGLWLGYLPSQLLWFVKDCKQCNGEPSIRQETPYRAPSFSWASLDGSITPGWFTDANDTSQKIVAEIVEAFVEPETDDMFGPVRGGFVRIRGHLKRIRLSRMATLATTWNMEANGVLLDSDSNSETYEENEVRRFSPQIMLDVDQPGFNEEQQSRLYCMPVEGKIIGSEQYRIRSLMGLLLEEVQNELVGRFKRIGVFAAHRRDHIDQLMVLSGKVEGRKVPFPCESYNIKTGQYTICII